MKIAVAGTGYVGLSLATLLSPHNEVFAVDIIPEKVDKINSWESSIQDDYIEKYLAEARKDKRTLKLTATTGGEVVSIRDGSRCSHGVVADFGITLKRGWA